MKLFTFMVFVLAFWPILLDCSLGGRNALVATRVFPTKTFGTNGAHNVGSVKLEVPPTSYPRVHNKKGLSSWVDSTISIWTVNQVSPGNHGASVGRPSIDLVYRQVQTQWSRVCHWWRIGSAWLVTLLVNVTLSALFILIVGIALLQKPTVERRVVVTHLLHKPTFVSSMTWHGGSSNREVHDLVARNQASIHIFTLEGRLVLYSAPTTSDSAVEWTVLLHPRQYYYPTGYPAESTPQFDVSHTRLLNILLRGVSAYHPWTLYLPATLVIPPGDSIKALHRASEPTPVAKITSTWTTPERPVQEQPVRRRLPARKPTFTPSIHRFGGPAKPAVSQPVRPKQPRHPAQWIEKFTIEGRLLLYAGSTPPGQPVKWIVQFSPRSGYHLTEQGDESSRPQREFVDGHLLDILLDQYLAYPRSVISVPDILLGVSEEPVKQSNNLAVPSDLLNPTTTALTLPSSAPYVPDVTTTIDYTASSIDVIAASVRLETTPEPEALVAPGLREDWSSAERVDEPIPANAEENAENSMDLLDYTDSQTPDSEEEVEPFTPISQAPTSPNHASFDATSDDFIREQKAAVLHELRLLFALLEERAGQSHAQTAWENAEMGVREQDKAEVEENVQNVQQDMAEEAPVDEAVQKHMVEDVLVEEDVQQDKAEDAPAEEDDQEEYVHERRKRRGGKRNTAWKHKRRQEKEDKERGPEAGPSGLH